MPTFLRKIRLADDGFTLLELAIVLFVGALILVYGLGGDTSTTHSANLSALENTVQSIQKASVKYADINGGFSGLSCQSLVNDNLWPAQGCQSASLFMTRWPTVSLSVLPYGGADYEISLGIAGYFTAADMQMVCQMFQTNLSQPCSPSGSGVNLIF